MTDEEVKQQLKDTDELRTTEQYESLKLYRQLDNQEEFKKLCKNFLLLHHTLDQNYLIKNVVDFKKNLVEYKNVFINIRDNVDETIDHLTSLLEKYESIILPLSA